MVDDFCVVVTASNDGLIKLWKLHLDEVISLCEFFLLLLFIYLGLNQFD